MIINIKNSWKIFVYIRTKCYGLMSESELDFYVPSTSKSYGVGTSV